MQDEFVECLRKLSVNEFEILVRRIQQVYPNSEAMMRRNLLEARKGRLFTPRPLLLQTMAALGHADNDIERACRGHIRNFHERSDVKFVIPMRRINDAACPDNLRKIADSFLHLLRSLYRPGAPLPVFGKNAVCVPGEMISQATMYYMGDNGWNTDDPCPASIVVRHIGLFPDPRLFNPDTVVQLVDVST